ncbi:MAG: hypothetical protein U0271_44965 [Polyangiaceae bacterium]
MAGTNGRDSAALRGVILGAVASVLAIAGCGASQSSAEAQAKNGPGGGATEVTSTSVKPAEPAPKTITLVKHSAVVGEVATITSESRLAMSVRGATGGPSALSLSSVTSMTLREECLEVVDRACTKVKADVIAHDVQVDTGSGPEPTTSSMRGKSYVLTRADKSWTITDATTGKPATAEETSALGASRIYNESAFTDALPETLVVGQSLEGLASLIERQLSESKVGPTSVEVRVKGVRRLKGVEVVVASMRTSLASPADSARVVAALSGELLILVDGALPTALEFSGPLTLVSPSLNGAGTASFRQSASYSRPAGAGNH